jgi:hypothetical protein
MKHFVFTGICLLLLSSVNAQKVLVLENMGTGKTYRFFEGNEIAVKTGDTSKKVSGKITDIMDSSIIISNTNSFNLKEISIVYKNRRGIELVSYSLMAFGAMFFILDVVNNGINGDKPMIRADVTLIAAAVSGAGGILQGFTERKCVIRKDKWRLKIIDQIHVKP